MTCISVGTVAPNGVCERPTFWFIRLAGETVLGPVGFTRWCAASMPFYRSTLRPPLDYFESHATMTRTKLPSGREAELASNSGILGPQNVKLLPQPSGKTEIVSDSGLSRVPVRYDRCSMGHCLRTRCRGRRSRIALPRLRHSSQGRRSAGNGPWNKLRPFCRRE